MALVARTSRRQLRRVAQSQIHQCTRWFSSASPASNKNKDFSTNTAAADFAQLTPPAPGLRTVALRTAKSAEVAVSKIFFAGFGWQGMSVAAEVAGHAADSLNFALYTGVGDFLGVAIGHTMWFTLKKAVTGSEGINVAGELQTGLLLGSAAFCSGTAWQPAVNFFHDVAGLSFAQTLGGVSVVCGSCFYAGLRVARPILSKVFTAVDRGDYDNLKSDAMLSASVGLACGFFVGTDLSFATGNFLASIVGITDAQSTLQGMCIAGTSTALGFSVLQTFQNMLMRKGENWID